MRKKTLIESLQTLRRKQIRRQQERHGHLPILYLYGVCAFPGTYSACPMYKFSIRPGFTIWKGSLGILKQEVKFSWYLPSIHSLINKLYMYVGLKTLINQLCFSRGFSHQKEIHRAEKILINSYIFGRLNVPWQETSKHDVLFPYPSFFKLMIVNPFYLSIWSN